MLSFAALRNAGRFTAVDAERLQAMWPIVAPAAHDVCRAFVEALERAGGGTPLRTTVAVANDAAHAWLERMFCGPHDDASAAAACSALAHCVTDRRQLVALGVLREGIVDAVASALPATEAIAALRSAERIVDIGALLLVEAHADATRAQELRDFRDLVLDHLPNTVLVLDAEGRIAAAAHADPRIFAHSDVLGLPLGDAVYDGFGGARIDEKIRGALAGNEAIVLPRVDVDIEGTARSYRIRVVPVQHPQARALVTIEEVTEAVAHEQREHLIKLGTLATTLAHEVRNPLAGISGVVQVISATLPTDDRRREALGKVQEQMARLGALVGDLLTFSRPVATQTRLLDLVERAEAALATARKVARGKARIEGTGQAHADSELVAQAVAHLIENAWQAGAGEVRIEIADGRIRVLDDGPGIAAEARAKVFEPFFTTKTRGTGLGLPVARKVVEAMGGSLELCSSPLGGAGFELRLPA